LSDDEFAKVEQALAKGAEANGYAADLWTLPGVAEVIERVTGVSYHPGHVLIRPTRSARLDMAAASSARSRTER
jgi:hypothetical protein